ncbi:ABC transporter substrate-binding protein [Paracidovorax citrulli]
MQIAKRSSPAQRGLAGVAAGLTMTTALLFGSGVAAQPRPAATPKPGGTLTIGTEADPSSLDPLRIGSYVERQFAIVVYDTLFDVDVQGRIVPSLATGYQVSPDGRKYTLSLREGVKFHDGTPFNAEAVVFNLDRVRDPANTCRCLGNVAAIESVKATGPYKVEIQLKTAYASFPAILTDAPAMMVSPTAVRADPKGYGNAPVGTGPFKLVEWTKGSRFIAEKNPHYWKGGQPYLDRVVLRGLQNSETREATMQSGALDVLTQPPPKFAAAVRKDKRFAYIDPTGFGSMFVAFNLQNEALKDVRVRMAIAHATQRELLVKAIYHGLPKVATTPFGYGLPGLSQVKDYPEYNLPKAKALLAEYGKPVSISILADNQPVALMTIQALQQMWQKVGIKVELKLVDQARLVQNMLSHEFDAALFRWSGRPDPDLNVYGFFHSSTASRKVSSNYGQYASPEMDRLLDAGRQELDPARRAVIYNDVSRLLARDVPYVFLSYIAAPIIATHKVRGIDPVPDSLVRVASVWKEQ